MKILLILSDDEKELSRLCLWFYSRSSEILLTVNTPLKGLVNATEENPCTMGGQNLNIT